MKVKVCGMKDPDNIEKIAATSPDFMGFIFYENSKRNADNKIRDLVGTQLPGHIKKTGVFVNDNKEQIRKKARLFNLDYIQLHGNESPELVKTIKDMGLGVIKVFRLSNTFNFQVLDDYQKYVDFFLFDTKGIEYGGTGQKFDWNILKNYHLKVPFFLSGGIGPGDWQEIKELKNKHLFAVDINSKFEREPGIKEEEKVKAFIENIRGSDNVN